MKNTIVTACIGILAVMVSSEAVAQVPYRPTPGGANRWVYVHERLYPVCGEEQQGEDVLWDDNVVAGVYNAGAGVLSGAGKAIGGLFGAAFTSITPVAPAKTATEAAPASGQSTCYRLKYRHRARLHGLANRWTVRVED